MDGRVERRLLQKAAYVRDAIEVLASKRDTLDGDAFVTAAHAQAGLPGTRPTVV